MILSTIENMISKLNECTLEWLRNDGKDIRFIDPIDNVEISAHYGATHASVAWIIYGIRINDESLINNGISLLTSVLDRWEDSIKLPAFHFDFNNFALCVVYDYIKTSHVELAERVKNIVLSTPDSNNPTINWYPMRWYVNILRYRWTQDEKYKNICNLCKSTIKNATFEDGFIDDRIPKGKSFNLQYDLATVAVMQYINVHEESIDLKKELSALLNVVSPDGDINYLGRGANQVFAWGPWIYLLSSANNSEISRAVDYLSSRLDSMLTNNNMMLNEWPGKDKYLWWDYHYCSVYTAHLLFWLTLTLEDNAKATVQGLDKHSCIDSGLLVHRTEKSCVVTFAGRTEYLAERGPAISLISTERDGVIVKGCFAPWQGPFGNNYTCFDVVLRNYCGLIEVRKNKDISKNRYLHKMLPDFHTRETETVRPLFVKIDVSENKESLCISWSNTSNNKFFVNVPVINTPLIHCEVDGNEVELIETMKIKNQYDWVTILQSREMTGHSVKLKIAL